MSVKAGSIVAVILAAALGVMLVGVSVRPVGDGQLDFAREALSHVLAALAGYVAGNRPSVPSDDKEP